MRLKKTVKNILNLTSSTRLHYSVYYSFYKRHQLVYQQPSFKLDRLTASEKKEYLKYWRPISTNISLKTVEISKSLSGRFDKHIVPEEIYALYIEPMLNNDKSIKYLENKSIYNKWFSEGVFPKDYFHKIDNCYYNSELELIEDINSFIEENMKESYFPLIIKPNRDSYGGADIYFVDNKTEIFNIIEKYSNLVVQEKLNQSELLNAFNPASINTVRVCLYRDSKGILHVINTSLRMGKDGSLDNETAGGIVCNIKASGILNNYAVDKFAVKYFRHPNSKFEFKDRIFPMYNDLLETSIDIGNKVLGASIISLDMALDFSEQWRCIEINLFGQTVRFAQYAGESFFREYTDEVIASLLHNKT